MLHKPTTNPKDMCSRNAEIRTARARHVQRTCPQVQASAANKASGFLNHIEKVCRVRLMKSHVFWKMAGTAIADAAETGKRTCHAGIKPKGSVKTIASAPTNRSATKEARLTARSYPSWIAPASRTTSPPIVVGKKLLENRPVNVSASASEKEILTFPARSKMYQRSTTQKREHKIRANASRIWEKESCLKAFWISSQP